MFIIDKNIWKLKSAQQWFTSLKNQIKESNEKISDEHLVKSSSVNESKEELIFSVLFSHKSMKESEWVFS